MIKDGQYVPVIALDGPGGAGKGEISRQLAETLSWHLLDSGALYRALALLVIRQHLPLADIKCLVTYAEQLDIKFVQHSGTMPQVILAGEDITQDIRQAVCGSMASRIAMIVQVRESLIALQRCYRQLPGLVADGRDMGTKIFPDAQLKVFLTADTTIRAKRRLLQLQDQGISGTLDTVLKEIVERDKRDQTRSVSPLKPDKAAMIIDTTKLTINEVLQQILVHVA